MATIARTITGGVDTHLDVHVAAALDERGSLLGTESFPTTPRGYALLLGWLYAFGTLELVGVEGPAATGPGSPVTCTATGSWWSKWTDPTARSAGARARPTPSTRCPPPVPPKVAMPTDRPRPEPETSRPEGVCPTQCPEASQQHLLCGLLP
jgi:hypothetical protein